MDAPSPPQPGSARIVRRLVLLTVLMFGFGFGLVPLYDVFCDLTGLNGKTSADPWQVGEPLVADTSRSVQLRFLATNNAGMVWQFRPLSESLEISPGQAYTTHFYARNPGSRPMIGQAVPSVVPARAADYLLKTECFCFEEQRLEPGEEVRMPLRFVIDPDLPEDIRSIVLSYTLFDVSADTAQSRNWPLLSMEAIHD